MFTRVPRAERHECPLEREARIVTSATPRFAMQLAHKYGEGSAMRVINDLKLNHNRVVAKAYVQNVADAVAAVTMVKEEQWGCVAKSRGNGKLKTSWLNYTHSHAQVQPLPMAALSRVVLQKL